MCSHLPHRSCFFLFLGRRASPYLWPHLWPVASHTHSIPLGRRCYCPQQLVLPDSEGLSGGDQLGSPAPGREPGPAKECSKCLIEECISRCVNKYTDHMQVPSRLRTGLQTTTGPSLLCPAPTSRFFPSDQPAWASQGNAFSGNLTCIGNSLPFSGSPGNFSRLTVLLRGVKF